MIKIEFDEEDGCLTEDTSIRLKMVFKGYYAKSGVPGHADEISDAEIRRLAQIYQEEFGESADEYERDHAPLSEGIRP